MSAPETTDPLVVNTTDGTVWTRREATRDGLALYAPEKCAGCPEFVMATYAELEGHGVAGTADVLPMPVGSEPQALSPERLAEIREHVAETRNWSLGNLAARDLLAEVDRLRAERDEFCSRVDTLTAVAQGNKRHVVSLTVECQRLTARITELEAERHSTNAVPSLSFAERAAAESDPGRRAAYRMLAESDGEFDAYLRHPYRVGHDLPETGGQR